MQLSRRAFLAVWLLAMGFFTLALHAQGFDAQKGENDWLILTGPGGNIEDYLHSNRLSDVQLDYLSARLASVESSLKQRGMSFLWVIPPNTPTVYPESMPKRYKQVAAESRLVEMNVEFAAKGITSFVDLTQALLAAKSASKVSLYSKTDTHWTDVGAFAAYEEIMRRMIQLRPDLRKQLTPPGMSAYTLSATKDFSGGLAGRLGLSGVLTEDLPILIAKAPGAAAFAPNLVRALGTGKDFSHTPAPGFTIDVVRDGVVAVSNAARCPGPSLAMIHDSFGIIFAPWMANHFCSAIFYFPTKNAVTGAVDRDWLMANRPTFVVLESVERYMTHPFARSTLDKLDFVELPANTRPSAAPLFQ